MSGRFGPLHIVKQNNRTHSGIVIFFHGSGDKGQGIRDWVKFLWGNDFSFPHLQVVYPTAPLRPYTPLNGEQSTVWYDRHAISPDVPDHKESLDAMGKELSDYIQNEIAGTIPLNRIIIGGFSMGGGIALHLAYRFLPEIAGIFTLSSFLGADSLIYDELKTTSDNDKRKQIPLLMFHGERDDLVPIQWGKKTHDNLLNYGAKAEFHNIENTLHEIRKVEIEKLNEWILKILPPLESDK